LPLAKLGKSYVLTLGALPAGYHSRPGVLNSPMSSFFLVSMLIAGCPAAIAALTVSLICRNWASRSGCCLPSNVLRADCKLNPSLRSSFGTVRNPTGWPCSVSSAARFRELFDVQSSTRSGSPRVSLDTNARSASNSSGSECSAAGRPAPAFRTRPTSKRSSESSRSPRRTVFSASPQARAAAAIPPRPNVLASDAANARR